MSRVTRNEHTHTEELSQSQQTSTFSYLLGHQWNNHCADCSTRSPTWASIDFGAFICIDCAGAHRALGPTITRVRSTNLDVWKRQWIYCMVIGNDRVNEYWEGDLVDERRKNLKLKPTSSRAERERWAVVKYVRSKYVSVDTQNIMVALKTKIHDEKRLKLSLMEKVRALEEIREHETYVENHYERVIGQESAKKKQGLQDENATRNTKPFDFFEDEQEPVTPVIVQTQAPIQAKIQQTHLESKVDWNFGLPCDIKFQTNCYSPENTISVLPTLSIPNQVLPISPSLLFSPNIPINLSFLSPPTYSTPQNPIPLPISSFPTNTPSAKTKSPVPSLFSAELELITFDEPIYKKTQPSPINILSQGNFIATSYDINFNPIITSTPLTHYSQETPNHHSKYESFNEFNW